jgi:DNA-binding beta-propeller fold protein YncE
MKISRLARRALGVAAAATMLAGCEGGASHAGLGSSLPATQSATWPSFGRPQSAHSDHRRSWMAPDAKNGDLLYISDIGTNDVYVYSYPKLRLEGTLTGFATPYGECVDKAGDVFITNFETQQIFEYAHGGTKPIATLNDSGYYPSGCSIDPTTGNLAVANYSNSDSVRGNVAIYVGAAGAPAAYYTDDLMYEMFLCSYDNNGDLFVDGEQIGSSGFVLAELARRQHAMTDIFLNQSIGELSGVQWDGRHLVIGDGTAETLYQFNISGVYATKVGSTPLNEALYLVQFTIQHGKVVGPYSSGAGIWNYPSGGSAIKTVDNGSFNAPWGSAISNVTI